MKGMDNTMKKVLIIVLLSVLALGLIPIRLARNDGGTVEYVAVFYRVIKWKQFNPHALYDEEGRYIESDQPKYLTGTDFYIFPFNFGDKNWEKG